MIPVLYPDRRAGDHRAGPARLRDVALLRAATSPSRSSRRRWIRRPRSMSTPDAPRILLPGGLPASRRRGEHPLARRADGAGAAPAARQDLRGARLCPREQAEPHHRRLAPAAPGHHRLGQELPRRAAGARGPGHRREARGRDRHPPLQGRHAVAAGAQRRARVRRGAGGDPRGRGEAPAHRVPAEGAALQLARRRAPARDRQVRRARRVGSRIAANGCCRPRASSRRR